MQGDTISQVAERTGFPATTLRYYEQAGLVTPARSPAGYRLYGDRDLDRLAFIGRAKGLGLSLDEITDLLRLLDDDRCAPVQEQLRTLVADKLTDAQRRIADLVAFTAELQRVAVALGQGTPDGPCDDTCGCTSDPMDVGPTPVALIDGPPGPERAVACTLSADRVDDRVRDWQRTLAPAIDRSTIDGGVRVHLGPGADAAAVAALAAAEQDCCRFFRFRLTIDEAGVALDVTGPPDAQPVIAALVGVAG